MLWVGTSAGLYQLDPVTEALTKFPLSDAGDGLPGAHGDYYVRAIFKDSRDHLWVGTATDGLLEFNADHEKISHFRHEASDPDSLSNDYIYSIHEDRTGQLWVGTLTGLDQLNQQSGAFRHYVDKISAGSSGEVKVRDIYEDQAGVLWIGTDQGLCKIDGQTGNFTRFQHRPGDPASLSDNDISGIWGDSAGLLWIGAKGGMLNAFDSEKEVFRQFPSGEKEFPIYDVYKDRSGVLWIGTDNGGLLKMRPQDKPFQHWVAQAGNPNSLNSRHVKAIYEDKSGNLWIGTVDGGLNRYDPKSGVFTYYRHDPDNPHSLPSDDISAIIEDPEGFIWIGTQSRGLTKFDPQTEIFTVFRNDPSDEASLIDKRVRSLFVDSAGRLWVGCNGGLQQFNGQTGKFKRFLFLDKEDVNWPAANKIRHITEDKTGMLWIATDDGVIRFDPQEERLLDHYRHETGNPLSLSYAHVRLIHEDSAGNIWVGTRGGLSKLVDGQRGEFVHYTEDDGLPSNVIYGLLEDEAGNFWISTPNGLSQFNPQKETFFNYGLGEGLLNFHFEKAAYFKARDGEMYFGGLEGMDSFYPDQIGSNQHIPPIVITSFEKFGKKTHFEKAVSHLDLIKLSYKDNFISFEFTALDFVNPKQNQYAYKLEGFDSDWIHIGNHRRVTYTNLDPGDYVFRVRGSNNDGIWNEKGASIKLSIASPFWATWWFRALVVGAVAAVVAMIAILIGLRRKRAQLEVANRDLRNEEARVRTILDTAVEGIISFDKTTRIKSLNPAARRIFGYEEGEAEGKSISLLVVKSDRIYYFRHLKNYLVKGRKTLPAKPRELLGLRKDGSSFPIEVTVDGARIDNGHLFIGTVRDITERKKAESTLTETRNWLEMALRGSNLGLWDANIATREARYDERWANMLGYELDEIKQTVDFFESLRHPDDSQFFNEAWMQRMRRQNPFSSAEFRLRTKDGGWKWIFVHGQVIEFDAEDNPLRAVGIHQDITERKQAEEAIRQSEERYRSLFENSPIPHWEEDFSAVKEYIDSLRSTGVTDFREYFNNHPESVLLCGSLIKILDVNQATVELYKGKNKSEFLQFNSGLIIYDVCKVLREELIALCEGKTVFESEIKGKDLEGNPYHVILNQFLIPGYEDTWSKIIVTNVDILKRKEAEEQAARLGHILEESLNEIYIFDALTLKFLVVNRGARENLQYNSEELAELTPLDLIPESTLASFEEILRPMRSGAKSRIRFTTLHKRKNGSTYPMEVYLHMSTFGATSVFVAIIEDITEIKIVERNLRENEARLSTILNTVADGIVVFDKNKQIETFNPAAEKIFDYSFEEISRLNVFDLLGEEYREIYEKSLLNYLATGVKKLAGTTQEVEGLRKDGSTFPAEFLASVAEMEGGPKMIVLIKDITERKRIEQELENHRQNLEYTVESRTRDLRMSMEKLMDTNLRLNEVSSHRSRFISSVSHELRTPLSAIIGFADLYKKSYGSISDKKQNSYIENISNAGKHLLHLINGLLDLAKIDSGKMDVELETFPIGEFIKSIVEMMSAQFKEKNLHVETFIDPHLKEMTADRKKCNQIMLNLLSNAFKFTPVGGRIDIRFIEHAESGIRVEVSDTGIGIDPVEKSKIFSEYYQIGKSSENMAKGTGIGLALTRRLVELHGGEIGVESVRGSGSTFWFTLPQNGASAKKPETNEGEDNLPKSYPTGRRILIAEDSELIRIMLLDMLGQHKHQTTVALNGLEAVELAIKLKPELILMDMRMPVMDGLEATRRIRSIPDLADTPIIALTASAGEESEGLQAQAGCTDHLAKPIMAEELFEMLKRYLEPQSKEK